MARWLLVRHGETEWNRTERAQGQADVPLNQTGRSQALALARALAGVQLDAAFSSDLVRALDTAQLLVNGRGVKVTTTSELREISYGKWEGFTRSRAEEDNPELFARMVRRDPDFVAPGGESAPLLLARVKAFATRTRAQHSDGTLLVVAHVGSLRALLVTLLDLPWDVQARFKLDPASLSILEVHPPGCTLVLWNDTSHYHRAL